MSGARKPRPAGSSFAVIGEALDAIGPRKVVADFLDVGTSKAAAWSDPDDACHRAPMTYAQARVVARGFPGTAGVVFARDLAGLAGGVFVPGVPDGADPAISGCLTGLLREHAEAVGALVEGLADGALSDRERDLVGRELDDLMTAAARLRAAVQARPRSAGGRDHGCD